MDSELQEENRPPQTRGWQVVSASNVRRDEAYEQDNIEGQVRHDYP